MMLHLFSKMKFFGVFSLLMVLAFVSSETENKQKTLEELIKEESGRESNEQKAIEEPRNQNVKTIDQLIEEELAREKTEPSDKKEKKDLKSGIWNQLIEKELARENLETDNIQLEREYSDSSLTRDKKCQNCGKTVGGAVYTRWGRTECPSGSEIVYRGVAGGAHYTHTGGASNYICLPLIPIWGYYNDASIVYGKVYGAELEQPVGFDLSNNGGNPLHNSNVLCVVCRSLSKSSIIMIPGRNRCHSGWEPEYDGYLMTGAYSHVSQNDYACMDRSPEAAPGGYRDENGALFYNVEGGCGSLPCPPYVEGRELTCVVCGK